MTNLSRTQLSSIGADSRDGVRNADAARVLPRSARFAFAMLGLVVLATIIGPWLSPHAVDAIDFAGAWSAPPTAQSAHWFGTDSLGRDVFARLVYGSRVSLAAGIISQGIALALGGGAVDITEQRAVIAMALAGLDPVEQVGVAFLALMAVLWVQGQRRTNADAQPVGPNARFGYPEVRVGFVPAMVMKDGRPWLSFGVMGGDMQPQGHVQVLLNILLNARDAFVERQVTRPQVVIRLFKEDSSGILTVADNAGG